MLYQAQFRVSQGRFVLNDPLESFDTGVQLRLPWLNVAEPDSCLFRPLYKGTADFFRPRMDVGFQRHSMIRSSARVTRPAGSERTIPIAKASLFKSAMTSNSTVEKGCHLAVDYACGGITIQGTIRTVLVSYVVVSCSLKCQAVRCGY